LLFIKKLNFKDLQEIEKSVIPDFVFLRKMSSLAMGLFILTAYHQTLLLQFIKALFGTFAISAMAARGVGAMAGRARRVFMEAATASPDWKAEDLLALAMYPFV
jgi:hypothetical protein